jgi:hypothetical protein
MEIHNYVGTTGEFLSSAMASPSPLEPGAFLIPAYATTVVPPSVGANQAAVFDVALQAWRVVADYRGRTLYRIEDGGEVRVEALEKTLGDYPECVAIPPPAVPEGQRLRWTGDGWALEDVPPVVPDFVSMRQARLALLSAGLLDSVEAAIAGLSGDAGKAARIEWEYATEIRRNNPLFAQLSAALGLSGEALDQLFIQAATL